MAFSQKINAAAVAVHFRYTDAILRFNSVAGNHWVHRKHTPAEKEWERERENKKIRKNCQELNDCLRAEFFNECEYFCGAFENAATSPCSRYIIIFCNFLLVGREWQQPRDDDGYDDDDDDVQVIGHIKYKCHPKYFRYRWAVGSWHSRLLFSLLFRQFKRAICPDIVTL